MDTVQDKRYNGNVLSVVDGVKRISVLAVSKVSYSIFHESVDQRAAVAHLVKDLLPALKASDK